VHADLGNAGLLKLANAVNQLRLQTTKFGFVRLADDSVTMRSADIGAKPECGGARRIAGTQRTVDQSRVIKIDDRAEFDRCFELRRRRVIRREKHLVARYAQSTSQVKLRHARTIDTAAFVDEQLNQMRIGIRLDREELTKVAAPTK